MNHSKHISRLRFKYGQNNSFHLSDSDCLNMNPFVLHSFLYHFAFVDVVLLPLWPGGMQEAAMTTTVAAEAAVCLLQKSICCGNHFLHIKQAKLSLY